MSKVKGQNNASQNNDNSQRSFVSLSEHEKEEANRQLQLFHASKKCSHEMLVRNNYDLPNKKSAIST
jgi:hypothetical protein